MTRLAWVIGHPIGHSISPAIHNAAFADRGLDARYEAVDLFPEELAAWVTSVRAADVLGFNVTVPHKERVAQLVDELEADALLAGAVNTVIVSPEDFPPRLIGTNTDTIGFRRSLAQEARVALGGRRVVVLGAGGAARAVSLVALQDGAASLTVANRHSERAEQLLRDLDPVRATTMVDAVSLDGPSLRHAVNDAQIIVNATSVGMRSQETPIPAGLIRPGALVVDLVYNPLETVFLRSAAQAGARVLGGLGMLLYQAAGAFERWTGCDAPIDAMRMAAVRALEGQQTDFPRPSEERLGRGA